MGRPEEENGYVTLRKNGEGRFEDRRSVFLAYAARVNTEDEANAFVAGVRDKHADARHVVFAYSVRNGAQKKYSDDGEPQGSAGRPVLGVLEKEGIDGAVIAVVRYFGGILLGTGGLVRAYSTAASAAVADAGIAVLRSCVRLSVKLDYTAYSKLSRLLGTFETVEESAQFEEKVSLILRSPETRLSDLLAVLRDVSSGSAEVRELERVLA